MEVWQGSDYMEVKEEKKSKDVEQSVDGRNREIKLK